MRSSLILGFFGTLIFGGAIGYFFGYDHGFSRIKTENISSFEECKAAGYPIMESYPEQCATPDGKHFVRQLLPTERQDNLPPPPGTSLPVVCPMDAKICPDGSAVGREGPGCEFRACEGEELPN